MTIRIIKSFIVITMLSAVASPAHAVESIEVQALFGNKAMVKIDGERYTLSVGKDGPHGVRLISADAHQAVLEVDGVQRPYGLGSTVSTRFTQREQVEQTLYANSRGMYLTTGTINGNTVKFLVDTGATTIAMNKTQARQLGIRYRLDGIESGASTASGYVKAYKVKLKSVTLGKIKQRNVDAMVIEGTHPGPILLGMSFLGKLKVEKAGKVLTIRQRK